MTTEIKPTAVPTGYSIAKCRENRAKCIEQARKRKDNGNRLDMMNWLGYALYWHARVTHAGKSADECQDIASARGTRWNVRSAAVQAATLKAITMNPPGYGALCAATLAPVTAEVVAELLAPNESLAAFNAGLGVAS